MTYTRPEVKGCSLEIRGDAPVGKMFAPTIAFTAATCLYIDDATFTVTPPPQTTYFNGQVITGTTLNGSTTFIKGLPGVYHLTIVDEVNQCSWSNIKFTIPYSMPDFKFKYNLTKRITDCSFTGNDYTTISVENPAKYSYLTPVVDANGLMNLTTSLPISFQYGDCKASIYLSNIQTTPDLKVQATKLHPITCYKGDGVFQITLSQGGLPLPTNVPLYNAATLSKVTPGKLTMDVVAGICRTSFTLDTQFEDPKFVFETTPIFPGNTIPLYPDHIFAGTVLVRSTLKGVFINAVPMGDPSITVDLSNPLRFITSDDQLTFNITWNTVCNKVYQVPVPKVAHPTPDYYLMLEGCPPSYTFVLNNYRVFFGAQLDGVPLGPQGTLTNVPYVDGSKVHLVYATKLATNYITSDTVITVKPPSTPALSMGNVTGRREYTMDTSAKNQQSSNVFTSLSNGDYYLLSTPQGQPYCRSIQQFSVKGGEPAPKIGTQTMCSANKVLPMNISFGLNMPVNQYLINFNGRQLNTSQPLPNGLYPFQINITDPICRRILRLTNITLSTQSVEPLISSDQCQRAKLSVRAPGNYNINFTNTKDGSVNVSMTYQFNSTSSPLSINLAEGIYTVVIQSDSCQSSYNIYVEGCPPPPIINKKNLAWISVLVVAGVVLILSGSFVIYRRYRMRR
ncbi:hypothetical protein SAMD00019534_071770 [Acytostelium subglobosum LB1]|uniref:hypothetical protein n=1 Tax=Acytostelium subglobosum LB1 TaxID=1410327 RepID=UPI000644BD35|nr:hypothetical protein SAMD00019534_071770 [Acytostelium subglobosum LB1]GAM24002.1 hypothetical protein SAMD00019534_071770 [Acytostelium subglobosum LB1]|eukprot:XP_012753038.1 hypothetical protein SAMD00019534_071770 [Acytostelium subglobosum LB1]